MRAPAVTTAMIATLIAVAAHAQTPPPKLARMTDVAQICELNPSAIGCVNLCPADRQLTMQGAPIIAVAGSLDTGLGSLAVAGGVRVPMDMTLDQIGQFAFRCDCRTAEVYVEQEVFRDGSVNPNGGELTLAAVEPPGTPGGGGRGRLRSGMCVSEPVTLTRPRATCAGAQAPFVTWRSGPVGSHTWVESDTQELCPGPVSAAASCPPDYTFNGTNCEAQSVDLTMQTETITVLTSPSTGNISVLAEYHVHIQGQSRMGAPEPLPFAVEQTLIVDGVIVWSVANPGPVPVPPVCVDNSGGSLPSVGVSCSTLTSPVQQQTATSWVTWTFPSPGAIPPQSCWDGSIPDPITNECEFVGPSGDYNLLSRADMISAGNEAAAPDFFTTASNPAAKYDPSTPVEDFFAQVGAYSPGAFDYPRIAIPAALNSAMQGEATALAGHSVAYCVDRDGGRVSDHSDGNAARVCTDIRPTQWFEDGRLCRTNTTDNGSGDCIGEAVRPRVVIPPNHSPWAYCAPGESTAALIGSNGQQVGWVCYGVGSVNVPWTSLWSLPWGAEVVLEDCGGVAHGSFCEYRSESSLNYAGGVTIPGTTVGISVSYYPNSTTLTHPPIRPDPRSVAISAASVNAETYTTQSCEVGTLHAESGWCSKNLNGVSMPPVWDDDANNLTAACALDREFCECDPTDPDPCPDPAGRYRPSTTPAEFEPYLSIIGLQPPAARPQRVEVLMDSGTRVYTR